jgi:ribose transport system ATP-binding protein
MGILRELPRQGTTVIYVSHRLAEVFSIAQNISVIRDGRIVVSESVDQLDIPSVVKAMVGESMIQFADRQGQDRRDNAVVFSIRNLATRDQLRDASLEVRAGEIVGIAGLVGSGAEEILQAIFGAVPSRAESATYPDGSGVPESPTKAAKRGIALVPADRKKVGVMLGQSIAQNVSQVSVGAVGAGPFLLNKEALAKRARAAIEMLGIKTSGPAALVSQLSGGNQQKVVIAKWLEIHPNLVLLDDPTRGVDVGAKAEIFKIIQDLAQSGTAVILRSTEVLELTTYCDRIYIIQDGVITGEASGVSEEELLELINRDDAA